LSLKDNLIAFVVIVKFLNNFKKSFFSQRECRQGQDCRDGQGSRKGQKEVILRKAVSYPVILFQERFFPQFSEQLFSYNYVSDPIASLRIKWREQYEQKKPSFCSFVNWHEFSFY